MLHERLILGGMKTNCYLVASEATRDAAVVDPGDQPEAVLAKVNELGLRLRYVINTHGHPDHTGGNAALKKATGAVVAIHSGDAGRLRVKDNR